MTIDLDALDLFPETSKPAAEDVDLIERLDREATYREQVAARWAGAACQGVMVKRAALLREAVNALKDARSTVEELLYAHTDKSIAMGDAFLARNGKGEG